MTVRADIERREGAPTLEPIAIIGMACLFPQAPDLAAFWRNIVSGVDADPSDLAVARAVVDMACGMGRACVAEGVETASQFEVLSEIGVSAYQGWLFSRPVPADQFRALLTGQPLLPSRAGR